MKNRNQSLASQAFRRKLLNIAWLPLALCITGASLQVAFAAETATLVLSGEAAPDGNGVYSNFSFEQTLNANGEVAFICEFTGTQNPATDSRGICLASTNSVKRLVHIGETVPDGNGTFNHFSSNFDKQEFVFLNDNGGPIYTGVQSNGPLRLGKLFLFEGGVRVPMILHWPGVLKPGEVYRETTSALDVFPTVCAAAKVELPGELRLDGVDLLTFLKGDNGESPHDVLFWSNGPNRAVRHGDWKLIKSGKNT